MSRTINNIQVQNAKRVLDSFRASDWKIIQAKKLFKKLEKESVEKSVSEIVQSPYYQNIVNILGPYAIYYKIDQVLKLLKELERQQYKPEIEKSPYFAGRI